MCRLAVLPNGVDGKQVDDNDLKLINNNSHTEPIKSVMHRSTWNLEETTTERNSIC